MLRPPGQSTALGPCPRCPAAREEKEESIPCVRNPRRILISAAPRRGALIAHNWAASCWKLKGAGWGMRRRWWKGAPGLGEPGFGKEKGQKWGRGGDGPRGHKFEWKTQRGASPAGRAAVFFSWMGTQKDWY